MNRSALAATIAITLTLGVVSSAAASVRVSVAKLGFSFSLPDHWSQIPLSSNDIAGILDAATKADPTLKATLSSEVRQAVKQGVALFAVGPVTQHSLPNVNVISESSSGVPSGKAFFDQGGIEIKLQLTSSGFQHVTTKVVTLGVGKVIEASYSITSALTKRSVHGVQFYVRHKTHFFIVTSTAPTSSYAATVASTVANSWHWR